MPAELEKLLKLEKLNFHVYQCRKIFLEDKMYG